MDCATHLTITNHVESAVQVISKERLHTWLLGAHSTSHKFRMFLSNKKITTRSLHMTSGWTWCATESILGANAHQPLRTHLKRPSYRLQKTHNLRSQEKHKYLALSLPAAQANKTKPRCPPSQTHMHKTSRHAHITKTNTARHYKHKSTTLQGTMRARDAMPRQSQHIDRQDCISKDNDAATRCCERCPNTQCLRHDAARDALTHNAYDTMLREMP